MNDRARQFLAQVTEPQVFVVVNYGIRTGNDGQRAEAADWR
jgi:hypothetical protein